MAKKISVKVSEIKKDNSAKIEAIKALEAKQEAEKEKAKEIKKRMASIHALTQEIQEAVSDPTKVSADLVQRFNEATSYSSVEEYMIYRDRVTNLLMCASDFNSKKLKAANGELADNKIKKLAGQRVIQIAKKLGIVEFGVIIYSTINGRYISNTTLDMLEELANELIKQGMHQPILHKLRSYLDAGGMMCPGDKELTPFTPEKTSRIKVLVKRFETAAAH